MPKFYAIFNRDYYIPETEFHEILKERDGIDNSPPQKGKVLNDMVCNRQRCLVLGCNQLRNHQIEREIARTEGGPEKKKNSLEMFHLPFSGVSRRGEI